MSIEAMKQWLAAIERVNQLDGMYSWTQEENSLRQAIAEAEPSRSDIKQEPVATDWNSVHEKLIEVWNREISADDGLDEIQGLIATSPPQRPVAEPHKPLTDEQKVALCKQFPDHLTFNAIHAIEAAHGIKEKNT